MPYAPILIRHLTEFQLPRLLELRNLCREAFFDSRLLTEEDQRLWWKQYTRSHPLYQVHSIHYSPNTCSPRLIGFLSARWLNIPCDFRVWEVGNLMMDPDFRGRGFMNHALHLLWKDLGKPIFIAHVQESNASSLRFFEKAGFWTVPTPERKDSKCLTVASPS